MTWPLSWSCLFSNDPPGILVSPQADKFDMAYVVRIRPFEEFAICYELGLYRNALLHLRGSESLTPPATLQFRQVRERTFLNDEWLQLRLQFTAGSRNQTSPDPRGIYQRISAVEADHKGINSMTPRSESADYELLPNVESLFCPSPGSLAGFVVGGKAFRNDTLPTHLPYRRNEPAHRTGEML